MLCIQIEFIAGRFHATPWGRHVNEGVPEWPPSPYRIARAVVDAWHRRRPDWPLERVTPLLEALAGAPQFWIPASGTSHVRLYMDMNSLPTPKKPTDKKLIFDAFATMEAGAKVVLAWPEREVAPGVLADLDELLRELSYLGRAESLTALQVLDVPPSRPPDAVSAGAVDRDGDRIDWECVTVACVQPPADYEQSGLRPEHTLGKGKKASTVPWSWVEALSFSTADLLSGWNRPPVLVEHTYRLKRPSARRNARPVSHLVPEFSRVRFTLGGKVRPPVTATLSVAEQVRRKLMGIHRRLQGGDPSGVSGVFSGKASDGTPLEGHRHAFFLPMDQDGDGFLDHLLVTASEPFTTSELMALDRLTSLWQSDGRPDIDCVLSGMGGERDFSVSTTDWVSATPFIPPRFHRRRDGELPTWLREQILTECRNHGIPFPVDIDFVDAHDAGLRFRWFEFMRSRKGDKPRAAYGVRLRFPVQVTGPVSLGYGCHYGMGRFVSAS